MRNEKKIVLTHEQYRMLAPRVRALAAVDAHVSDPEGYFLSSLYFDDVHDTAYYEKVDGTAERKKYRIRIYNGDLSCIKLECKHKRRDRIEKRSERLSPDVYLALLDGDLSPLAAQGLPLSREFFVLCRDRLLSPRVAVTYRREAYVHPLSNTRITFDKELRAGYAAASMLRQGERDLPVFPTTEFPFPGAVILEIKYDTYLASHLAAALQCSGVVQAASKYCLCRDALQSASLHWQATNQTEIFKCKGEPIV